MLPVKMKCPEATSTADMCELQDIACMSASLHKNGFVVMKGPVAGYDNVDMLSNATVFVSVWEPVLSTCCILILCVLY